MGWNQEIAEGDVRLFWLAFALRGGVAIAFAGVLRFAASLLRTVFLFGMTALSVAVCLHRGEVQAIDAHAAPARA